MMGHLMIHCTILRYIDALVTAEIPDPSAFPHLHKVVTSCLLHGPYGRAAPNAPCMVDGSCSKKYPRSFLEQTTVGQDGYPEYRRRDSGLSVSRRDAQLDNQWVVPFNAYLASKYAAHINVEASEQLNISANMCIKEVTRRLQGYPRDPTIRGREICIRCGGILAHFHVSDAP